MSTKLPRSYAPLIGGTIRDARIIDDAGVERLVIELENGAQFEVAASTPAGTIEVSQVEDTIGEPAAPASFAAPAGLEDLAGAARALWRSFADTGRR